MSKGNDHLFELIQTMSSSEKRYFKRHALIAKDSDVNYLKLFDALNKMKVYDEASLKKKPFVKHFASERKYLYEAILRSLRNYNREESVRAQIYELLLDSDYLFQRGLYDQSERRLKKAHRLAEQIGYQSALLEINTTRRRMLRMKKTKSFVDEMQKHIEEKDEVCTKMENDLLVLDLLDELFATLIKNHSLKNDVEKAKLEEQYLPRLNALAKVELSLEGERHLYLSYAFYYRLLSDYVKTEEYFEKINSWWESHTMIRQQKFDLYINGVGNYLGVLIRREKFGLASKIIQEFDELKLNNHHEKKAAFEKSSTWKILYHFSKRDLSPIHDLIPEIENGIKQFRISDYSTIVMESNFILFYFLMEAWDKCLQRIEPVLVSKRHQQREGVLRMLSIIGLIAYFESGNIGKVETMLRNTQRYFEKVLKNKKSYEFELLSYFRKLINTPLLEQKLFFKSFKLFLEKCAENVEGKNTLLAYEELSLWVNSRFENVTILEVFQRQKVNK